MSSPFQRTPTLTLVMMFELSRFGTMGMHCVTLEDQKVWLMVIATCM
jgi:hypothetical protein